MVDSVKAVQKNLNLGRFQEICIFVVAVPQRLLGEMQEDRNNGSLKGGGGGGGGGGSAKG